MAEAAAEPITRERLAFAITELAVDAELRQKAASFIGAVAAGAWHEAQAGPGRETDEALRVRPIESLHDAIQAAATGDETGRKMVEMNAGSDVIERTLKAGHIREVDQMINEAGDIHQNSQSMESIQANTLRFASGNPKMRGRGEAETRNAFRIKYCYKQKILKEHYLAVFSRAADNMTKQEMRDAGFFIDTMSCGFQLTSEASDRLVTDTAFVAGVTEPGGDRHDQAAVEMVLSRLGVDVSGLNATELLDKPILIHKSLLPDGALTVVEMYDDAVTEIYADAPGNIFFGQDKPRQDYQAYRQKCIEREKGFQPKVDQIVRDLIAEARTITGPVMAIERLNELPGKYMIELAAEDTSINPDVFGPESSARIEMARWHIENGNMEQARHEIQAAILTDQSNSCPSGRMKSAEEITNNELGGEADKKESDDGDCDFISKECPECGAKNVKTMVRKKKGKTHIKGDCGCEKVVAAV